jgi:hypothetical protein
MATKNIPNLTLNTWGGALGYTLSSALSWAYGSGLINYIPDNNLPLPIVGNTLYIDVNAGGNPNSTSSNYFYIHSNKDNIDLNCNEFKSNTGSFGLFIGGALHSLQSNSFNNIRPITINWSALNTNNTFANSFINNCDPIIYNGTPSFNLSNPSTSNSCFQLFANTTYNCNAPAAQINFTAIGGVAPINYSINGSAQSSPFIAASGSYTIVATDANSNTASTIVTITLPTPLALSIATTNVPCYNGNNGTAISTVTGSVSPYHYFWTDNTGNLISNQTIYDDAALHLTQGNYTLTVTDAIGCTATNSFTITQPAMQNTANIIAQTSVLCQGGMGGSATVAVVPSNSSYTYSWSATPVQTTATATNLAAGTYTATVTNGGYCAQTTVTIAGLSLSATAGAIACNGLLADVKLTTSGGAGTITTTPANINLTAGTYTFTATDANYCTATAIATISAAPSPVTIALAVTQPPCNGTTGSIAFTTSGGTGTIATMYSTTALGTLPVTSPVDSLPANTYTFYATDANNCIVTTTFTITQPSAISINSITHTNVTCFNASNGTINIAGAGGTGIITYALAPNNVNNTTGIFTGLNNNLYSLTVSDANGCSTSDTISITQPTILTAATTLSDVSCTTTSDGSIQLSATGGTPSYTYNWSNGATTQNLTNLSAGTYSCTITDANGCSTIVNNLTINAPSGAYCCNTNFTNAPTHILADNINSSTLSQSTYSNTAIMVNGTFTIDNNLILNNCQLYFTENALIQLSPNYTLTLNNCTLQAGCAVMWDGIYADDASEQIVLNGCTISDMENGVVLSNQAKISAIGNTFTNNYQGLFFYNILGTYNSTVGNCIVQRNTFTSTGGSTSLLPPYSTQNRTETGIVIFWCNEVQIGVLDANDPTNKNTFDNIYNGILVITSNNANEPHQPLLYNNDFNNIHNDPTSNSFDLLNNIYTTHRGAGIFATPFSLAPQILTNIHYLTVNNVAGPQGGKFTNCDKAIVSNKMGADIRNTNVENTLFGFMHSEADGQKYLIGNLSNSGGTDEANYVTNVQYGIQISGTVDEAHINQNTITTNLVPLSFTTSSNAPVTTIYPVGISVNNYVSTTNAIEIRQNNITLPCALGTGIYAANTGNSTILDRNTINLNNAIKLPKSGYFGTNGYFGIEMTQCKQSTLIGNHVNGPGITTMAITTKPTTAIRLTTCPNLHYECNHIQNTFNGWLVQDDCNTGTADIVNNDWNHHYHGIVFWPLGQDGTLGNIGDPGIDYNYNFAGNYDNDPINDSADRLFRIMQPSNNFPTQPVIYAKNPAVTTSLNPSQSGSNILGNQYIVDVTTNPLPTCDPTYSIVAGDGNAGNGEEENQNINEQNAMQLVHDSVAFYANPAVAQWLAEMRLYEKLSKDSVTREGNLVLNNFYDARKVAPTGAILEANISIQALTSQDNLASQDAFTDALVNAKNANEAIDSELPHEDNERLINTIYFNAIEYGADSLSTADKLMIEYLAKSCPLINGNAVYKARTIWQHFQPWVVYDNIVICNNIAQNKTSSGGPFDFVFDNLENSNNTTAVVPPTNEFKNVAIEVKKLNTNTPFSLLPNPAQSQITIKYKLEPWQTAKVIIYDAIGAEVQSIELPTFVQTVSAALNNISNGTYTYKYIIDGMVVTTNKLIVIK